MRCYTFPALALLTLALAGCGIAPTRPDGTSALVQSQQTATAPSHAVVAPAAVGSAAAPATDPSHTASSTTAPSDAEAQSSAEPTEQQGLASWYGPRFHGRRTASGERYNMHAMTAAHPKLPLGSYARVTAVASGKSVVVRITDRGPYVKRRIIDLSKAAAARLGLLKRGVGEVVVQSVPPPDQFALAE
ncbi:MAG: Septum-associated rare lipoprotein A [Burkholderiaceae bacterium]|jgi:rare lipoprotein A|nr:MAG: Septum-associated rare lipoprotein A [Burkholderiaceae bacterium]